jgi:hypothetical protein
MGAMQWDLGPEGVLVLAGMSAAFAVAAHLILAKVTTRWVGLIAAGAFFVVGILVSEVWFGWATAEELQPNVDGLSFDEVLMTGLLGVLVLFVVRHYARRGRRVTPGPAARRQ